jgi:hypothetical protein
MSEPTTQPTIDWRYLPELPPEPEKGWYKVRYLVASDGAVHEGWYEGNSKWSFWSSGEVYAWAAWPVPPGRKSVSR